MDNLLCYVILEIKQKNVLIQYVLKWTRIVIINILQPLNEFNINSMKMFIWFSTYF